MKERSPILGRSWIARICILSACLGWVPAAAEENHFSAKVGEGDYQRFINLCDPSRIDPKKVETSPFPAWGVAVTRVDEGAPADRAGLKAGWIFKTFNGKPYWHHDIPIRREAPVKDIVAISPDGTVTKEFHFGPGRMGYSSGNAYRPENDVLGRIKRGPWDREMLIAAVAWEQGSQDIAETALHHATAKGMPENVLTLYYSTLLEMERGEATAAKMGLEQMKDVFKKEGEIPRFFIFGLHALCLAYNDFKYLAEVMDARGVLDDYMNRDVVDGWIAKPPNGKGALLAEARAKAGDDLFPATRTPEDDPFVGLKDFGIGNYKKFPASISVPPAHYRTTYFVTKEPVRNAIWNIRFSLMRSGPPDDHYYTTLKFALIDRRHASAAARAAPKDVWSNSVAMFAIVDEASGQKGVQLSAGPGSRKIYLQRNAPYAKRLPAPGPGDPGDRVPPPELPDDAGLLNLTLIRLGDEIEINLDDKPLMRIPIDPAVEDLGFYIQNVGFATTVKEMTIREIKAD
ncbi:hypothetical protein OVA24_02035 [Luteolibacter sp. SL250]|uniref:hypothetical protein n=1 Tax=Luteolibacter sp. SL250 TaxID=2995170 RepID=UPI0022710838|nr:hypothetical protein [Luteolibacter sp. SL250]WAC20157.1 hypothetical protein OVA24_02035 [Luteolibacter sp. SL250]